MNSSQGPTTEQLAGRVFPPLRGSRPDYPAVTNILPVPSLALNKLILRTRELSQQQAFSVNSGTQVAVLWKRSTCGPSLISAKSGTGLGDLGDH